MKNFIRILITILFLGAFTFTYNVKAQMSGTYTVGSGGAYSSLTSAYNDLVSNGVNGPVTLSVISDLSGQQTLSGSVTGASATNKITITSSTGNPNSYTIGTNSNYALYFQNGVNNVLVKDITIGVPNNSTQYYGIYFNMSSTPYVNLEFKGCNINAYSSNSGYAAVYYSGTSSSSYYFNNLRFIRNNISGGYYNIFLQYPAGTNTNMSSRVGVTIDSNVLTNAYYAGIYSYYYAYYPSISHNTITSSASGASTYYGIYTYYYTTIDSMIGNKITITTSSQAFGMYLSYYQNYSTSYGASGPMFIANNEIRILSSASTSYGLYAYGSSNYSRFDILNNSIYMNGTSTCYGLYWYPYSSSYPSKFINNNVHINTSGTAYMVNFGSTSYMSTSYVTMDYNNYYRTGTGTTTYYGSSSYSSLASWKTAYSQDANTNGNTINYADLSTGLEMSSYSGFTCPRIAGVLFDIRNNARGTTTYRGCYEPFALDAATDKAANTPSMAILNQNLPLSVILKNAGLNTITSASIGWTYNNVLQTPITWTGSLISGGNTTVALDTVVINSGSNNVKVWVSNPNATTDPNPMNDTTIFSIFGCDSLLHGTYTVGGASADFNTLTAAVTSMMNCGINGPTTFMLNNGIYNEAISLIGTIPGASTTNLVTFTSVAGSADSVQIYASGTTWLLSEISNLRFKDITIGTTSSIGEKALVFDGNCSNIEVYRCNLYAYSSATAASFIPVYYYNGTAGKCLTNVKFIKNNFVGGFVNMCLFTNSSVGTNAMGSVTIDSNTMKEGYRGGFARDVASTNSYYMYFPSISYNTIVGRAGSTSYQYGICLGSANVNPTTYGYYDVVDQIVGNKIRLQVTSNYACGILLSTYQNYYNSSGSGGSGTQCLVANNEIIHNSTSVYSYGIWAYYSKANLINNSIYLKNTTTSYQLYGIYIYNSSTSYGPMTIKNNNIFVDAANPANGYPIYYSDGSAYLTTSYKIIDYNNYYSTGTNVAYAGGNVSSLTALQNLTGQDVNSVSISPRFENFSNNLKVYGFDLPCATFTPVTIDLENISRGISTTTMGAYQFIPYVNYDIQPYALASPATVVSNGVSETVRIDLLNVGTTTITSATINWSFNNVARPPINWTGSLSSGSKITVTLDTITPIGGKNTLVFITSLPNNQVDTMIFNDTLSVSIFACDSMLSGTYTVGTGGQFLTIDDALGAIKSCGVKGTITLSLLSGIYPPISINGAITGLTATNTLTITSATGNASNVTLGNSVSSATTALSLTDVNHIIFKNITIGLNSSNTGIAVELNGMCENLLFYECNIQTYQTGTGTNYCGVKYYNSSGSTKYLKDVRFIKNNVDGGYYNFWIYYGAGSTTNMASTAMSVTIDSNTMTNAYYAGIYSYYYARYQSISYNSITSRNSGSVNSNWYGMYFYYYHNVEEIVGNKIRSSNTSIGYPYGMYIYYYFNYTSYYGSGAGLIANNEIILRTTSSYYGMYLYYPYSNIKVLHNSIYMYGTGNAYALYTYNGTTSYKPIIKNNNFVTVAGTSAYPIYYNSSYYNTSYFTVDYNNYYSSGSYVGYAGSARTTLAALQTATLQDANSTNMNPGYAVTPTNLTPTNWSMCPVMTEVPKDISGNLRLGITYKGCYTAVFANDGGLIEFVGLGGRSSAGTNSIKVRLMNFGTSTLTSIGIQCSVGGVLQTAVNLTGLSLAQYQDTIITVGSFVATIGVTSNLKAWTYNPNASSDQNYGNDTISLATIGCALVLNGTYDVGGGNNDFSTIAAAISALTNCGVSGPVVLRLATGTYNTLSSFTSVFYGTSEINTVTFTSLSGNASDVVIGSATNAALTFSGAKYLHFDKITIGNTNGNTTYGVYFQNTNECIEFYGCNINSYTSATSSSYACVYYNNSSGSTQTLKKVRFIKNNINGGYYNFYMYYPGSSSTDMSNMSVIIDSNMIQNAYYYAIYSYYYAYYPSISYNTITSRNSGSVASNWFGMYLYYYHSVEKIEGNTIKSTNTSIPYPYGMYIYYYLNYNGYGTSNSSPLIANNEIILYTTSSYYGIYLYYPYSNVQLLHNSVYMYGSGSAYALYTYNGTTAYKPIVKNNIFMTNASTTAYPIYYNGNYSSAYYTMDYNNYYSSGTYIAYAGSAITTLVGLQGATGQDANSISQNPNFITPTTSLHTSGASMLIDPISTVPYDKNGLARIPVTNIGCYHDFEPEDNDAKMAQIVSPGSGVSVGVTTPITVKIMNFGVNRLDSVKLNWRINGGTLNTMNYYCNLAFGATSSNITLGSFIPVSGLNTLLVYTTNPNGVPDENTSNDTIVYVVYACDSMLNGIYTVGSGGNFASLDVVLLALKNCGVSGPVELRMASGTYPGLTIDAVFPGTSSTKMVTITSASGNAADVIFNVANSNALVLNGAKDIKFKKVTFGNTTNALTGVSFNNTNTNIEFYECNIYASLSNTSSTCAAVYYNNSSGSTNTLKDVRFIKNTINGGYSNFWFYYPAGSTSNMSSMSVIIDSNIITGAYLYAIYAYYYGYYPSISYNTITPRMAGSINTQWMGLYLYYYNSVEKIEGNRIISTNVNIMYPYGMYIYYYLNYNGYGTSNNRPLIANNEIILYTTSSYYGVYLYYPYSNVQFLNNSIYMYGTGSAYAMYTYNGTTSYQTVLKNNIFATAAATTAYPIYYNGSYYTSSYFTTDYNNYYSTGMYIAYAGSAISSLSGLQSATGQDANSLNQNPNFLLPTTSLNTDGFEMLVPPLVNVPYDIDGKSRGFVTNIGCYHDFDPYDDDAKMVSFVSPVGGVVVGQSTPLTVTLMNMGLHNLDSVRIHWSVNNGPVDSVNYYCNLAFGAISSNITLDTFIPVGGTNSFRVYTTLPNGTADEFPINDTIQTTAFGCDSILSGVYTVGTGGDLANVYEAVTALYQCGIKGPVEFRFMAGSYGNLTFNQNVPGSSTTNTITFTSLSGNPGSVTFASLGDVALTFDNVSNFIFKNVTLNATLGTHAVEFKNTCSNIVLYGCNIIADPTTTQTYAGIYRNGTSGSSASLSNIRIIKNNISGGYYNIYWYYGGGSSSYMGNNCVIDSNVCTDAYYYGIRLYYSYTNFNSVSYNKVTCRSVNAYTYFYGISFYYYNNVGEAVGNKVHIRNSAVNYAYPMYIYYYNNYTNNPFGSMLISNNEIISEVSSYSYGGIYVYMNTPAYVLNNSIYASASSTAYGLYLYTTSTSYPIVAKNNNVHIANASTGYPLYISSTTYAASAYTTLDYNNYYNTTYVGYVGGTLTTLAQLRSATGQDVNSVSILPSYINLANNLELVDYSNFLCDRLSNVLTDINGESRTILTPMGAYSVFVYEGYDMAITSVVEPVNTDDVTCYQNFASIKVAVANRGSLPIDFTVTPMVLHVDVQGIVNFQADTIISVGALTATRKDTIEITDLLPVSLSGAYNITAWLEMAIDELADDDTIQSVYIIDKISIPYNINFDTLPNGLVFKQLAGSSGWTVESGNGVNPSISPSHGSGRLQFLSESGRGSMARVTLQPFNLQGSASPQMKFWYAHDNGNPMNRDYTEVKISVDGGSTYSTLLHLQRYNAAYATPTFVRYEINLAPYTAYSCVILAFEAGSYAGGNQNIDSIAIISKQDISLELNVTEQSEFVACELDNKEINVKLTNLTAQVFNFGNNPSQINVKVSGAVDTLFTIPLTSGTMEGDTIVFYDITNTFDFSTNGTYNILAYLSSADDNTLNDTARQTRIVQVDAELIAIDPIASKDVGDLVSPTVYITNKSNMPINDIALIITINNVKVVWETIDTLLNPGDSISYTFIQPYTVPNATEQQPYYQMKIEIDLPCDANIVNNSRSSYYNVNIEGSIDLVITEIYHPEADSCKPGFTKIYPSIEVYNGGTGYAQGAMLYVLVDSLGTIIQSFSEVLDDVVGQGSITFNCSKYYTVPNFKGNYTLSFNIVFPKDVNNSNNSKSVVTCAEEFLSVIPLDEEFCSLGQNIPNPATSITVIPYSISQEGKVSIKVMSVNGQILYREEIEASSGTHYVELNTTFLSNGIYYYSMEYQGQRIVKKMTIQK